MTPALAHGHVTDERAELPVWPLWLLFGGFPVFWVLGLGGFVAQIAALPMAGYLLASRGFRIPRGYGVWMLFLLWMLFSGIEVSGAARVLGFIYRATLYFSATVVFLYVYNSSSRRLPINRAAAMATTFLAFVVVGGLLGAVAPYHTLHTPFGAALPASIARNDLVAKLVNPPFAQVLNSQYVHVAPRPAAPFPYTNVWGVNFALLVPFVVAWMSTTRRVRTRIFLIGLTIAALIPAVLTSNRGMLLGLSIGFFYAAVRFAARGHGRALVVILVFGAIAGGLFSALHLGSRLDNRLATSQSNTSRSAVYAATLDQTEKSPVLGFGAPAPSTVSVNAPDLGTQGQLWTVLYSSGFPGVTLFVLALGFFAWATRRPTDAAGMWMHVVTIIALSVIVVYQMEATELVLLMMATALALRERPPSRPRRQLPSRPVEHRRASQPPVAPAVAGAGSGR